MGTKRITSTRYRDSEVIINEIKALADLIKLEKMEFDVILGIDWLSACCAYVDCYGKRIIFRMEEITKFFEGMKSDHAIPIISTLKATKLIRQGCREFMASVIDTKGSEVKKKKSCGE